MTKKEILNGSEFQILNNGMDSDYIYQFEKDDDEFNNDRIITYYDLGDRTVFWETNIIDKFTDKYITVGKVIMGQLVRVKVKIEDLTPYKGSSVTNKEKESTLQK